MGPVLDIPPADGDIFAPFTFANDNNGTLYKMGKWKLLSQIRYILIPVVLDGNACYRIARLAFARIAPPRAVGLKHRHNR